MACYLRSSILILGIAALSACGSQENAAGNEGEPILDVGEMSAGDAAVPGTDYHATATVSCAFDGLEIEAGCDAGIVRGWGEDGSSLIEIAKPDGFTRAIFVEPDGTPFGADSAEADGSAGWDFTVTREGDLVTVAYGPESYSWPDAFVTGD